MGSTIQQSRGAMKNGLYRLELVHEDSHETITSHPSVLTEGWQQVNCQLLYRETNMKDVLGLGIDGAKPAPSPEVIEKFQRQYQVHLPQHYLVFLNTANGGYPDIGGFSYVTRSGQMGESAVSSLFWLTDDRDDQYGLWWNTSILREVMEKAGLPVQVVAIGENGGNDLIYLDMTASPSAVHILYRTSGNSTPKIATSFEQFIDNLYGI